MSQGLFFYAKKSAIVEMAIIDYLILLKACGVFILWDIFVCIS